MRCRVWLGCCGISRADKSGRSSWVELGVGCLPVQKIRRSTRGSSKRLAKEQQSSVLVSVGQLLTHLRHGPEVTITTGLLTTGVSAVFTFNLSRGPCRLSQMQWISCFRLLRSQTTCCIHLQNRSSLMLIKRKVTVSTDAITSQFNKSSLGRGFARTWVNSEEEKNEFALMLKIARSGSGKDNKWADDDK